MDDSKLSTIVSKWSIPVSPDTAGKLEINSDDESASDSELKIDECGSTSQDESSREDNGDIEKKKTFGTESVEEGNYKKVK